MMNNTESAMVNLALALQKTKSQAVGPRPDSEELAAYFDGGLDATRRAQILSHMISDSEVYSEWLNFVEYADDLGLQPAEEVVREQQREIEGDKTSIWEKITSLFDLKVLAPGLTFAAVAAFVFTLQLQQPSSVGDLYSEFGSSGELIVELPARSLGNFWKKPESETVLISQGVLDGLKSLNVDQSFEQLIASKVNVEDSRDALGVDQSELYEAIGQWAALSQLQCQTGNQAYYDQALSVLDNLKGDLGKYSDVYANKLIIELDMASDDAVDESVCAIAGLIMKRVI